MIRPYEQCFHCGGPSSAMTPYVWTVIGRNDNMNQILIGIVTRCCGADASTEPIGTACSAPVATTGDYFKSGLENALLICRAVNEFNKSEPSDEVKMRINEFIKRTTRGAKWDHPSRVPYPCNPLREPEPYEYNDPRRNPKPSEPQPSTQPTADDLAGVLARLARIDKRLSATERSQLASSRPEAPPLCGKRKPSGGLRINRPGYNGSPKCTRPRDHDGFCSWANKGLHA